MIRLNQKEHLFRLGYAIAVVHFEALLTLHFLQDVIAFLYEYRSNLHHAYGVPTHGVRISFAFHLDDCIMIGFQLKASAFLLLVAFPPANAVVQHMARVITTKRTFLTI